MRLTFWTALAVFLVDQASKWFVVHWLDLGMRLQMDVLPPWLNFRMAWNRGVNFGILSGHDMRWALVALALVISGAVLVWIWRERRESALAQFFAGCLVGGAIGNVMDRLLYGAVADFLNMSLPGLGNPWSFNLADVAVFVGALGLVLFGSDGESRKDT